MSSENYSAVGGRAMGSSTTRGEVTEIERGGGTGHIDTGNSDDQRSSDVGDEMNNAPNAETQQIMARSISENTEETYINANVNFFCGFMMMII